MSYPLGPRTSWWQLAEMLRAPEVRVAFSANAACRVPFVARKAQRYCQARCAPSAADRDRAYCQRHGDKLNRVRRRRYDAGLRAQHGVRRPGLLTYDSCFTSVKDRDTI